MNDVHFTMDEVADILELSHRTLIRYIQGLAGDDKRLPHAYLPHKSRKKGYRIPSSDLTAYAARTNSPERERLESRIDRAIRRKELEEAEEPVAV